MKQLQTILASPFVHAPATVQPNKINILKRINFMSSPLQRIIGKWRLYLNYCPECNSCAPKIHHCEVCNADTKSHFNWSKEVEKTWWNKYVKKHHIAM
jgi:hypothetical protein